MESICPPYSSDFVHLFMPMVENEEITGTMRGDGENDPLSEFIGKENPKSISGTCPINYCSKTVRKYTGSINNLLKFLLKFCIFIHISC